MTSSTKDGSCADGTFPVASSPAYPFAIPFLLESSAVNQRASCFPFHVAFSASDTLRCVVVSVKVVARSASSAVSTFPLLLVSYTSFVISPNDPQKSSIKTRPVIGFTLIGTGVFPSTAETPRRVNRELASCRAMLSFGGI